MIITYFILITIGILIAACVSALFYRHTYQTIESKDQKLVKPGSIKTKSEYGALKNNYDVFTNIILFSWPISFAGLAILNRAINQDTGLQLSFIYSSIGVFGIVPLILLFLHYKSSTKSILVPVWFFLIGFFVLFSNFVYTSFYNFCIWSCGVNYVEDSAFITASIVSLCLFVFFQVNLTLITYSRRKL